MTATYLDRLAARSAAVGSVLCVGLDPDPAALPAGFSPDLDGIERFVTLLIESSAPVAAAVKPNLAFYEAFGAPGLSLLERVRARIPADVPVATVRGCPNLWWYAPVRNSPSPGRNSPGPSPSS